MPIMQGDAAPGDLTLRELAHWAEGQAAHIAARFGLGQDAGSGTDFFALAQSSFPEM